MAVCPPGLAEELVACQLGPALTSLFVSSQLCTLAPSDALRLVFVVSSGRALSVHWRAEEPVERMWCLLVVGKLPRE